MFQYLKGAEGKAASTSKNIIISESNYGQAWEKLILKYDKNKQILSAYIKAFFTQPLASATSLASLPKQVDTSDKIIKGVLLLRGSVSAVDPWLIDIVSTKCDNETRQYCLRVSDIQPISKNFEILN